MTDFSALLIRLSFVLTSVASMKCFELLVLLSAAAQVTASLLKFPADFEFGAATAAYQVEGAWNVSDKSENVWDRYTHSHQDLILENATGDVACDSYNQYRRDIEIADELGLDFYRLSISWSRLLPTGFSNKISEDGKRYYNDLIDGLIVKGIKPTATLYHFDLPQRLQDLGGWANPLISDWFASYSRIAFSLFGDRVKTWFTINEPLITCDGIYTEVFAPGFKDLDMGLYLCSKNVLSAHAKAWRIYDQEFRPKFHGQVSLSNLVIWFEMEKHDESLFEYAMDHCTGRFSHPIYSKEGGWPRKWEKLIADNSLKKGYKSSRLPPFTQEEVELIRGTYDFYGINHYTTRLIRRVDEVANNSMWSITAELGVELTARPEWKPATDVIFKIYPKGFRRALVYLKEKYGNIPILVSENGFPTSSGALDDTARVDYLKEYLTQLLFAMNKDGVNVTGYTAWSLMDNFEWRNGFTWKFGLYHVNFSDPNRTRTARASAHFYADLIKTHSLEPADESQSYVVWITIVVILAAAAVGAVLYKYYRASSSNKRAMDYEGVNSDDIGLNVTR